VRGLHDASEIVVGPTPIRIDGCENRVCTSIVLDDDGGAHLLVFDVKLSKAR
jgi:hypothetical protein